jgi:hypothetical protein
MGGVSDVSERSPFCIIILGRNQKPKITARNLAFKGFAYSLQKGKGNN